MYTDNYRGIYKSNKLTIDLPYIKVLKSNRLSNQNLKFEPAAMSKPATHIQELRASRTISNKSIIHYLIAVI